MKLELFYPTKPYVITQAFGIYNPFYLQFGYDHHNGIDFSVDSDKVVRSVCDGIVVEVRNYPTGAGNAVRIRTNSKLEAEGETEYIEFMYMHGERPLVSTGQQVKAGDAVMIADTTGAATGPHTHISAYFVNPNLPIGTHKLPIGNKNSDYCFDFSKYYNGYYADDADKVYSILFRIRQLLINYLKK